MITAVFDCMVFLQAATNERGPAFACLALAEAKVVTLHVSPEILSELRDVLTRPKIRKRFPHLTQERSHIFLQKLATLADLRSDIPDVGIELRDAHDLPYLNLAVTSQAGYLVTRDLDLLDLIKNPFFVGNDPRLRILDPLAFLNICRLSEQSPSQPS